MPFGHGGWPLSFLGFDGAVHGRQGTPGRRPPAGDARRAPRGAARGDESGAIQLGALAGALAGAPPPKAPMCGVEAAGWAGAAGAAGGAVLLAALSPEG